MPSSWSHLLARRALLVTGKGQALATPHIGDAIESLEGLARLAENLVLPSTGRWEHEGPASS